MRWMLPGHSPSLRLYPSLNAQGPSAAGGGNAPHFFATCAREHFARGMLLGVFYIYRDYPGILIVLISFWSGMG